MITRIQLLKIANKNSSKKVKSFLQSENIAKKLIKGLHYKKLIIRETIFAKHKVALSNCVIIGKLRNKKAILYCFYYTKIDNISNNFICNKG